MQTTYIILGVIVLVLIWGIAIFNALTSGRNNIKNAEAGIEVQLRKRYDLVPNLVATVKGYAAHETKVFTRITELRRQAMRTEIPFRKHGTDAEISSSLHRIFAIAENYPQLKSNENFLQLQAALNEIEAQLAAARRTYNACVTEYNNTVQTFPSSLIASSFGFNIHRWFEIEDTTRQNPQIAGKLN